THLSLPDHERIGSFRVNAVGKLGEDVFRRLVFDSKDCVEPEPVDGVVANPQARVLDGPLAYALLRVVERVAPGRLVARGEPRTEGRERSTGADVVVDDVEDHAQACAMRGVDKPGDPLVPAVYRMRRIRVD